MIQLAYQPAYDPFHTVLRIIRLVDAFSPPPLKIEPFRVADFYLLFPRRLAEVTLPRPLRSRLKEVISRAPPAYGASPADEIIMRKIRPIQDAAIQTLVRNGTLSPTAYESGILSVDLDSVSEALMSRARVLNSEQNTLVEFLVDLLNQVPLEGVNGLKHRTGLGEYRYDAV